MSQRPLLINANGESKGKAEPFFFPANISPLSAVLGLPRVAGAYVESAGPWVGMQYIGLFTKERVEDGPYDARLYLYASADGIEWIEMNNGEPVLDLGDEMVKDPALVWYAGRFVLTYTTGDYGHCTYYGIATSTDLFNWTASTVTVSLSQYYTWDPTPFVDTDGTLWVFFSTNSEDLSTSAIYRMQATNDALTTWTSPTALTFAGQTSGRKYDPLPFMAGGKYYLLFGIQETGGHLAVSDAIDGVWEFVKNISDTEAQHLTPLPGGGWRYYGERSDTGPGVKYFDFPADFSGPPAAYDTTMGAITPSDLHNGFVIAIGSPDSAESKGNANFAQPIDVLDAMIDPPRRIFEDFIGGTTTIGVGAWGWRSTGTITITGVSSTSSVPRPGIIQVSNNSSANGQLFSDIAGGYIFCSNTLDWELTGAFKLLSTASGHRVALGLSTGGTDLSSESGVWLDSNPGSSSNFRLYYKSGGSGTIDSGVALDTDWHKFRIRRRDIQMGISIETGGVWSTMVFGTASSPESVIPIAAVNNTGANVRGIQVDWLCLDFASRP
jgi:hypothetical protein